MAAMHRGDGGVGWRLAVWGAAAALLLVPLIAMQFTREVAWTAADFAVMGALLATACASWELAIRMSGNRAYRLAAGIAILAAFLLVWINLAVGMIGSEDNPANLLFAGVLVIGIVGAVLARLQPLGLSRTLVAMALAHAAIGVLGAVLGSAEALILALVFDLAWLGSAVLFRKAAR